MKLLRKAIERDGHGEVTLLPEEPEDMWHTYNLLCVGDRIRASTIRRVQSESSTGTVTSERKRTILCIELTDVHFDTQACTLRVNGKNVEENEHVKLGAYHTIDLELNRKFTLYKNEWDSIALQRVSEATDVAKTADVAAVVCQEGLAYLCLITSTMTVTKAKIEMNIPRKRRGTSDQHDKGMDKFYDQIMQAIMRHIDFAIIKCVVLASPGFVKDALYSYMMSQAVRNDIRVIIENKSKFLLVRASSGHRHALKEVMADPIVVGQLADTKAQMEVKTLEQFYKLLNDDPDRAFYGYSHVQKAADHNAVEKLLVTDSLFRSQDVATRKKYVALVDDVKENGGEVLLFSSLHVSGEQLEQLSGIAAVLRFPMPHLLDDENDDSGSDSES